MGVCLKLEPRNGSPIRGQKTSPYSLIPSADPQGFIVPNWFQLPPPFLSPCPSPSICFLSFSSVSIYWLQTSPAHISQLCASQAIPFPCWIKERVKAPHTFLLQTCPKFNTGTFLVCSSLIYWRKCWQVSESGRQQEQGCADNTRGEERVCMWGRQRWRDELRV